MKKKSLRGFTIIELMVIVAIIAILAAIISSALFQTRGRARNTRAESEMTKAGIAIESYKVIYDNNILIVQQPYAPANPNGGIALACFNATVGPRCFPTNLVGQDGNNGFTDFLFSGKEDTSDFSIKITSAAATHYTYVYVTEDCSYDSLASSGGVHKYSVFYTYLLVSSIDPATDGSSVYEYWIKDGDSGYGTDPQVPLPPMWNPQPCPPYRSSAVQTTCKSLYP